MVFIVVPIFDPPPGDSVGHPPSKRQMARSNQRSTQGSIAPKEPSIHGFDGCHRSDTTKRIIRVASIFSPVIQPRDEA
jgi:hypothetical protein